MTCQRYAEPISCRRAKTFGGSAFDREIVSAGQITWVNSDSVGRGARPHKTQERMQRSCLSSGQAATLCLNGGFQAENHSSGRECWLLAELGPCFAGWPSLVGDSRPQAACQISPKRSLRAPLETVPIQVGTRLPAFAVYAHRRFISASNHASLARTIIDIPKDHQRFQADRIRRRMECVGIEPSVLLNIFLEEKILEFEACLAKYLRSHSAGYQRCAGGSSPSRQLSCRNHLQTQMI